MNKVMIDMKEMSKIQSDAEKLIQENNQLKERRNIANNYLKNSLKELENLIEP